MGTNYYAIEEECPDPCVHCTMQRVHIGKSLVMFQGYKEDPFLKGWQGPVTSVQDWKDIVAKHSLHIFDEYDREYTPEEFWAMVDATERENRERQYRWEQNHISSAITPLGREKRSWLDPEGFSFTFYEFS